jgi:hypothetical protein
MAIAGFAVALAIPRWQTVVIASVFDHRDRQTPGREYLI